MKPMKTIAATILILLATIQPAAAQDLVTGEPGETIIVAETTAPENSPCVAHFGDNNSAHPGNTARLSTTETFVEAPGFETGTGEETSLEIIADGGPVIATVILGSTGGTSTDAEIVCQPPRPPVTTTTSSTPPPDTTTTTVDCVTAGTCLADTGFGDPSFLLILIAGLAMASGLVAFLWKDYRTDDTY